MCIGVVLNRSKVFTFKEHCQNVADVSLLFADAVLLNELTITHGHLHFSLVGVSFML